MRARLARFAIILAAILAAGTLGYMLIEGWSFADAIYMTVITLSTVGFSEVQPLWPDGQLFTTALIVAGVGAVAFLFSTIGQQIVSGELHGTLRRTRMQRSIEGLSGHYIICGYGRVGGQVIASLQQRKKHCVVIEQDSWDGTEGDDLLFVHGDASDDDVLKQAGIDRAAGLVAATGDDPTNLYITVSAHSLRPDLMIVARANQPSAEAKLLRGGASNVISPYTMGGQRIATQLLHPSVTEFLDVVMHSGDLELWLEECMVWPHSDLHSKTVEEAQVRKRTGANILAVRRSDGGSVLTNPPSNMRFEPGDVLIALGTREQLRVLWRLTSLEP
jgi:voltage-gated potassium channel